MKKCDMNGNVIAEGYFSKTSFIKKGEYQETELDKYKKSVDFLITSCYRRTEIIFNRPVELECNRSITRIDCDGYAYLVTSKALEKLKEQYTWGCDF